MDEGREPNLMTYHTSDAYFNRLASGLSKSQKGRLQKQMNETWDGSCHGIAVSMALASQGVIGPNEGIDERGYRYSGLPKNNRALRDTINFYQLSQYVPRGNDTATTYRSSKNGSLSLHTFLTRFAQCAVSAGADRKPFVFSYGYPDGGHSIVAYGGSETSNGVYSVNLFDENSTAIVQMDVDCNRNTFRFIDGNKDTIDASNYKYLSYTGPNELYGGISTLSDEDSGKPVITISANKRFVLTNNRGETLSCNGDSYDGSMNVYNSWMTGEEHSCFINFEVDPFSTLTMTGFDEAVDLSAEIDGEFYSAKVKDASSVVLRNKGIDITGSNFYFKTSTTSSLDHSDLAQVAAIGQDRATLSTESGKIVVDSQKPLYNVQVSSYESNSAQTQEISGFTDHMEVTDGSNGTLSVDAKQAQVDLNECTFSISGDAQVYDGQPKTLTITGTYSGIPLVQDQDFTVTYSNNINAGTATATITGIGSYAGTKDQTFTIQKADNTILATDIVKTRKKKAQSFKLGAKAAAATTLSYHSNNKNIKVNKNGLISVKKNYLGKAVITITAAANENYNQAKMTVTVMVGPTKTAIKSLKTSKGNVIVAWKKNTTGKGYQIQYSTDKNFANAKTVKIKRNKTVKATVKKLKKGTTYYFRIRTVSGKTFSPWSKEKKVKVKK